MKKLLLVFLIIFVAVQANAQKWISLFDGKTTNGWHSYGKTTTGEAWKVEDGMIVFDPAAKKAGKSAGDIVTNESFNDFHLQLEWKIAKNGNSGIIFFVQDEPTKYKNTWHTGPEMQVLDNDGHPDAKIISHRAGNLYDLIVGKEGAVKPYDQWNKVDIIFKKGKLDLILNDVNVVSTHVGDDGWKELVRRSKFAKGESPDFAKVLSGHIALQDHGDNVSYRNIRIQKIVIQIVQAIHEDFMRQALVQAQRAFDVDEVPVGAVIVMHGKIIAKAYNQVQLLKDVTAHAEILAITSACENLQEKYLPEATLYVTIEPCLMCAGALYWNKIGNIVFGAYDQKNSYRRVTEKNPFHPSTTIVGGILENDCAALMQAFFKAKR